MKMSDAWKMRLAWALAIVSVILYFLGRFWLPECFPVQGICEIFIPRGSSPYVTLIPFIFMVIAGISAFLLFKSAGEDAVRIRGATITKRLEIFTRGLIFVALIMVALWGLYKLFLA